MTHFTCDGRYTADLKTYTKTVLERFGIASQSGATASRMIYYASGEKVIRLG